MSPRDDRKGGKVNSSPTTPLDSPTTNRQTKMDNSNACIVLTTFPEQTLAIEFAQRLVEAKLAACVNVLPAMTSVYVWEGKAQTEPEYQLVIKTCRDRFGELERLVQENHPYDLPEIVAVPVVAGLSGYLDWITESTRHD